MLLMTNVIKVNFSRPWHPFLEDLVQQHLREGTFPGVEIFFATEGEVLLHQSWGRLEIGAEAPPMTTHTIFDMASLTKPIATATAILILQERGLLELEEKVVEFIPEFSGEWQRQVTLKHLLAHSSGLPAWENLYEGSANKEEGWQRLMQVPLIYPPGTHVVYSCLDFLILGEVIRRVSKQSLSKFVHENIVVPLGLEATYFSAWKHPLGPVAPTQYCPWRKQLLRGVVHDENCYLFEEEGGNAGLFSSVLDLYRFATMIFQDGELEGNRILSPRSVQTMVSNHSPPGEAPRGLGWDMKGDLGGYYSCGELFSPGSIGHTGFTGTSIWLELESQTMVMILSNRVHLSRETNQPAMRRFRPRLHNILMASL